MKYIFYSVIFITLLCCNKKEENKPTQKIEKEYIEDPLVYEVINDLLELPEIKKDSAKYMLNTANVFMFDIGLEKDNIEETIINYFGGFDSLSINDQINRSRYSFYKQELINKYHLVDYDLTAIKSDSDLDSLKNHSNKYLPNKSISYPIFNKTKTVAFVSYHYNPHYGKSFFISKKYNKWEIIEYYEHYYF